MYVVKLSRHWFGKVALNVNLFGVRDRSHVLICLRIEWCSMSWGNSCRCFDCWMVVVERAKVNTEDNIC